MGIDFVDVDTDRDHRLFIDPTLIEAQNDEWCKESTRVMASFFRVLVKACIKKDTDTLETLLDNAHEPNETHLGFSVGKPFGKGSKSDSLVEIFMRATNLVSLNGASDLCLFLNNFDQDRMSDLLTNVLRKQLYLFTIEQAHKYKVELQSEEQDMGSCWNPDTEQWERLVVNPLMENGKVVLLVPKWIVRKIYVSSVGRYIQRQVLQAMQWKHFDEDSPLCRKETDKKGNIKKFPPTKKVLRKKYIKGRQQKGIALEYMKSDGESVVRFKNELKREIAEGKWVMDDTSLDNLIYLMK